MAHTHRTARYIQILRADPSRSAPALRRATVADVQTWKKQRRAFDDAKLRLNLATPAQLQKENSALRLSPRSARIVSFASYA